MARLIEAQIGNGTLSHGERAPSVRALSRSAGVSVATVNQAYLQLERRGLLEARPRSGYYVIAPRAAPAVPLTRALRNRRARGVSSEVIDIILESLRRDDMVVLNSAVTAFTGRLNGRLNRLTRQVLRDDPELPNTLMVPPGDEDLRRAVAARLGRSGRPVDPQHVVITAGTMEAIVLSLGVLCRSGDTVLVESPTYFGILQAIEHLRLKVVEVANHPHAGIDVDAVREVVKRERVAAAVLMPSFNNPTGAVTSDADKRRLLEVLAGAGVPVVEDDIYGDLHFGDERPRTLSSFASDATVVTCGSVSKTIALGFRIGWAVSPDHAADISRAKFCTSVASPGLQQRVLARYFESGGYDRYLRALRGELLVDRDRFRDVIARHFPEGTRVTNPAGGIVLWVQLPSCCDALALFHHALARRIGIAPGPIFSAKAGYRNYIRLAMGVGWSPRIERALAELGRLADR